MKLGDNNSWEFEKIIILKLGEITISKFQEFEKDTIDQTNNYSVAQIIELTNWDEKYY